MFNKLLEEFKYLHQRKSRRNSHGYTEITDGIVAI
jgi:hypothetical protein